MTTGELLIGRNLTITGPGATNVTVSGHNTNRVFEIATNVTVSISALSIANGLVTGTSGNTNNLNQSNGGDALGGGILNAGTLTLWLLTIDNCKYGRRTAPGISRTVSL